MSKNEHSVTVTIQNQLGMHARAATLFVQLASKYSCDVFVAKNSQEVNGKSIMGVLLLVAAMGSTIVIRAVGKDCEAATQALAQLVNDKFGEDQ